MLDKKTTFILLLLLVLALLLGGNFIRLNQIYSNPRGGYTTAEVSSAVIVVNGGNILQADYDNLIIRANEPAILINILGSGYERTFNITVININPYSMVINGSEPGSQINGDNHVRFTSIVPPRLVKDITLHPSEKTENFSFAVVGDSRDNPVKFQNILEKIEDFNPLFIIHLGDMVSEGTPEEYNGLNQLIGTSKVPIYTVLGNHDIKGRGRSHYSKIFGMYYHSFDLGNTHFILLDNAKGDLGQSQLDWLRNDLEKNNKSVVIVCMHMPAFDPRQGTAHAMTDTSDAKALVALFKEFQVDAVYTAHIHSYLADTQDGIRYIISGGGGAPLVQEGARYHFILTNISNGNITTEMIAV